MVQAVGNPHILGQLICGPGLLPGSTGPGWLPGPPGFLLIQRTLPVLLISISRLRLLLSVKSIGHPLSITSIGMIVGCVRGSVCKCRVPFEKRWPPLVHHLIRNECRLCSGICGQVWIRENVEFPSKSVDHPLSITSFGMIVGCVRGTVGKCGSGKYCQSLRDSIGHTSVDWPPLVHHLIRNDCGLCSGIGGQM